MSIINFNFGRSFFFNKGTKEIKILDNKPDKRGMYLAKISDLVKGTSTLRPIKLVANRCIGKTMEIEIF